MNTVKTLTQKQLPEYLLNVAIVRPVFCWGSPGIGKSSIIEQFASSLGLTCVSLLGSQLAPEDIIGVPQIVDGKSRFCPPVSIAKDEPYCLFLDELNACSHEVQKSFYSLIHEKRVGEYVMPKGSIVIGAGNRTQDSAIVKPMSSALINRLIHIHLQVSTDDWLEWAYTNNIHDDIIEYIKIRPDHLWSQPPKHEEPFSTPRSWHMLSDALKSFGTIPPTEYLESLAYGCLTPTHAGQFIGFIRQARNKFEINRILKGEIGWPSKPEDRDVLYFVAQSFRAQLLKELPLVKESINDTQQVLAHRAKALIKDLAQLSHEIAQMVVSNEEDGQMLPDWFMIEIFRDVPRLIDRK
jgi:hypothetical protein